MINAHSKLYAVLGHPVGHSLSPAMHNAALAAMELDAVYLAFDVPPQRLPLILPALAELRFSGLNLTVPLKEAGFSFLSDLDESAALMRSVNTIQIQAGKMRGYSTDGAGFLTALKDELGVAPAKHRVFVLGCGGAGRAVAIACAMAGAVEILLANRTVERAERLAQEIAALSGLPQALSVQIVPPTPAAWRDACQAADIIVQATSAGLHPSDPVLLSADAFRSGQSFYDLIYHVAETPMMRIAADAGAQVANGLGMLLHQGALALQIWTGQPAPITVMRQALNQAVYSKSCI